MALSGCSTAVVMDIGGTTTDTAAVVNGLPRMSGSLCDICGVTTSFRYGPAYNGQHTSLLSCKMLHINMFAENADTYGAANMLTEQQY